MGHRLSLTTTQTVPGTPEVLWARLADPAFWLVRQTAGTQLRPLTDGHYLISLETADRPLRGRYLGRLTLLPIDPSRALQFVLVLGGAAGDVHGTGEATLVADGGATSVNIRFEGQANGRLATLSPRLLETIGRSLVRRAMSQLAPTPLTTPPQAQLRAWPAAGAAHPRQHPRPWLMLGALLTFWLWRTRRR